MIPTNKFYMFNTLYKQVNVKWARILGSPGLPFTLYLLVPKTFLGNPECKGAWFANYCYISGFPFIFEACRK
jgi:hypothetical protein